MDQELKEIEVLENGDWKRVRLIEIKSGQKFRHRENETTDWHYWRAEKDTELGADGMVGVLVIPRSTPNFDVKL